ncbi:MAG: HAMP domain-containing histidine kinase [Clostridia bacterium]|nr:HAMP domain-containing histidine kinase [Clostridia bacterium]
MKSLFSKFLMIVCIVLILSFSVMFLSLKNMLENHFVEMKAEQLIHHAEGIQETYMNNRVFNGLSTVDIENEMNNLEQYFDAEIWIVDQRGYVYITSDEQDLDKVKSELNINEIAQIFDGKIINREGHYQTLSQETLITIGYPIKNAQDDVVFALYIHVPVPEVLEANQGLFQVTLFAFLIILMMAIGIIFVFTRKMIKDIKRLNKTVEAVSNGDYNQRYETKRKDEIGQLSVRTNEMAISLEAADEFRRHFISDISHDFRSPLTNIIGYSEGIIDGTILKEDYLSSIRVIRDESKRLLKLSDSILTLTDISKHKMEMTPINLEAMILQILDYEKLKIEQKSLTMEIQFPEKHFDVYGDENLIHRVIYNLVENSIKFAPEGSVIYLDVFKKEHQIVCIIKNKTYDEVDLNRIWDRFSKGDTSRSEFVSSFGLGLSIVKEILTLHHQVAQVYFEDQWICFEFHLDIFNNH